MTTLSEYLEASEPTRRERAENWRVGIGLQKVDGLEVSPYLVETARHHIEGDISQGEARRAVADYYEHKPADFFISGPRNLDLFKQLTRTRHHQVSL